MKILLLGEFSNLHWILAQGLRKLGHEVVVASSGDRFKNCERDINIKRKGYGTINTIRYGINLSRVLKKFRGYDVVQIINPVFLDLKIGKNLRLFHYLKRHNKRVFLGAFGTDYFSVKAAMDSNLFRYSEYQINGKPTEIPNIEAQKKTWSEREHVNREIANTCDGIIACLYEYFVSYKSDYSDKLIYIPEPINIEDIKFRQREVPDKVKFFIGIQTERSQIKGTDIMYKVLQEVQKKNPDKCTIQKAESIPYSEYITLMNDSDVLLDQLYSYTPAMNAFAAMAQGIIVVGGGEPESYDILNETEMKPVINVLPNEEDIFNKLEQLVLNKEEIPKLSLQSRLFVEKHHDYVKVAQQYADFWASKL